MSLFNKIKTEQSKVQKEVKIEDSQSEKIIRRANSNSKIKKQNIACYEELPCIESSNEVKIKSLDEICKRALASFLVIQLACDINNGQYDESVKIISKLLEKFNVSDCLNKKEKKKERTPEQQKRADDAAMIGTVLFSLVFAIALFMMLPAFIGELIDKVIDNRIIMSAIEGVIRLGIFLGYVALISLMKDIQRVFMYHGAEHKTINCFEAGVPLTPENVKKYSRYHKRCGTSFLFIVMIISIIVFMFISADTAWLRLVIRLLLVPVIAGISYEFIMFAGKSDSKLANALSVPGMWVQRLTTREPDLDMIAVAIKSVEAVIDWEAYQDAMHKGEIED